MRHGLMAMTLVLIAAAGMASAADSPFDAKASAAKLAAVGFVDDWNSHDMKSFAGLFTEDAKFRKRTSRCMPHE